MSLCFDSKKVGEWVCANSFGSYDGNSQAIGFEKDGEIVTGAYYNNFTIRNIYVHIASTASFPSREMLAIGFDYPFNQLKVNRLTAAVCSENKKIIRIIKKMGFIMEAELSQATPDGNLLIFRMFKNECKYLGGKYATFIRHS